MTFWMLSLPKIVDEVYLRIRCMARVSDPAAWGRRRAGASPGPDRPPAQASTLAEVPAEILAKLIHWALINRHRE